MERNHQRLRLIHGPDRKKEEAVKPFDVVTQKTILLTQCSPLSSGDLTLALRASEQRLSALLEDRGRIGRDLHDCVLQSLYAIGLSVAQTRRASSPTPQAKRPSEDQAIVQLNSLIHQIRQMIHGLEYGTVETFDLASELQILVDTYTQAGPLQIALDLQPAAMDVLTGEEEREILNIVREALSNSVRHAHASQATVTLQKRGSRIRLAIGDNGTGLTPNKKQVAGYGLANMAARAKKLGGHLKIRSHVGLGTHIIAEFSLEPILSPV